MKTSLATFAITVLLCCMPAQAGSIITDFVTVDGTDWAQPKDFTNLSWGAMDTVCPTGVCSTGMLNGFDMNGWVWAGVDDVNSLFNDYLENAGVVGDDLLVGDDFYIEVSSAWAPAFLSDFAITGTISGLARFVLGYLRETPEGEFVRTASIVEGIHQLTPQDQVSSGDRNSISSAQSNRGGWFYRAKVTPVPGPSTLFLLGLGLLALRMNRLRDI